MKLQIKEDPRSHTIGVQEIVGLEQAMREACRPLGDALKDKCYWNRESDFELSEYKSRDGFIPYSENCGGLDYTVVVPKCEEYEFDFLTFGEYDERVADMTDEEWDSYCDTEEGEGHLDAQLRVWFKFEGIDPDSRMLKFYLYLGGGNGDAPYFRTKYEETIFEAEFQCKTLAQIKSVATPHIKKILKIMGEV